MCRCVTCEISCAKTPASSLSVSLARIEPGVHADVAARQRERVDARRPATTKKLKLKLAVVDLGRQLRAEGAHVLFEERIVDDDAGVAQLQHDAAADLRFAALAERRVGRAAEIRQLGGVRRAAASDAAANSASQRFTASCDLALPNRSLMVSIDRPGAWSVPSKLRGRRKDFGHMPVDLDLTPLFAQDARRRPRGRCCARCRAPSCRTCSCP